MTDMKALSQGELLMTPALPVKKAARPKPTSPKWAQQHKEAVERGEAVTGYPDLASLRADQRRKAEAVDVPDATLADWYQAQCEAVSAHLERLKDSLRQTETLLTSASEGPWPAYWRLDARLRFNEETLSLLQTRSHALCCPNHGIAGVDTAPWPNEALRASGEAYEGLSLRGVLTGEGATAWSRYCEKCQLDTGIATLAQSLQRRHEEMTR